jgi:GcrA cell cycle regulator
MDVNWTDELISEMRRFAGKRYSASQIGLELGISRNAVIGKMRRLKIPLLGHPQGGRRDGDPRPQRPRRKRAVLKVPVPEPLPELPTGVTLMELVPAACRWPVGDPATREFVYCGVRRECPTLPYCPGHCRMAYRASEERRGYNR